MRLPTPKLPQKKAAIPLPTPRLPGGARAAAAAPPKAPSRTQDLRAASLASLTVTGPPARRVMGGPAQRRDRSPAKPAGDAASAFADDAWRSQRPIERRGITYQVVVRAPGALEVARDPRSTLSTPALIVSKVHDTAITGGFDEGLKVVGLRVVGISTTAHIVQAPAPPASLVDAQKALGCASSTEAFPKYVLLQKAPDDIQEPVLAEQGSYAWRDKSPEPPQEVPLKKYRLTKVLVATNRKPVLSEGEAIFSPTLDGDASSPEQVTRKNHLGISAKTRAEDEEHAGLWWGCAVIGYDITCDQSCEIENWTYLGWAPMDREQVLASLAEATQDAHVYVHGFNNSLQFACRTAALLAKDRISICLAWPSNPPLPRSWAIAAVLSVAERNYTAAEQQMQRSVSALSRAAVQLKEAISGRLDWTAHSMGCYLLLLALRDSTRPFARIALLAPDVPTWVFLDALKKGVRENVRFLHCFHRKDEAVEISRQRRGLEFPVPGNGAVLPNRPGVTVLDCSRCVATYFNHDYGRVDASCVAEQEAFFRGARPEDRGALEPGDGAWVLRAEASA
jgi:hypothetical protein